MKSERAENGGNTGKQNGVTLNNHLFACLHSLWVEIVDVTENPVSILQFFSVS